MATSARQIAAAILVLSCCPVLAQPPVAPPPHPPLEELVKEYVRLKLPLPPPDAPLVRYRIRKENLEDPARPRTYFAYRMGFQLPPPAPGRDPRYLIGFGRLWNEWLDPAFVEQARPVPESFDQVGMGYEELLPLAVQCKLRGWHGLADVVYAQARNQIADIAEMNQEPMPSLIVELRGDALALRERPFDEPGSDRKAILRQIKELVAEEPSLLTAEREKWLHQLELTVTPRKTEPGTVEALIDDLTEYWEDQENPSNKKGQEAYWKLAELGFDAVPALIKHLDDDRLSRATSRPFIMCWPYSMTVGHLSTRLLLDLAAREIGTGLDEARGDRLNAEEAEKWFVRARKIGEENWLLSHAVPMRMVEGVPFRWSGRPEALLFRVIGAKYPDRLPDLYRAVLKKPPTESGDYTDGIVASKLTREQKIALLEEGLKYPDHRWSALEGLSNLDKPLFGRRLLEWLKQVPDRIKKGGPRAPSTEALVSLVKKSEDRRCWDEFLTATKAAPYGDRIETIWGIGPDFAPDEPDPLRRERLRFLVAFLNDREALPGKYDHDPPQIRDFAAFQMAGLFRFPVERDFIESLYLVRFNHDLGPLSRLILREAVRQLARRELARAEK